MAKIAIIGAGLAGVQCSKLLLERGHDVSVFEKSRGVGGRMSTKRLDWAHLDLGAQYFTARSPTMRQCVDQWVAAGWVSEWPFTPHKVGAAGIALSPDDTRRYIPAPDMNSLCKNLAEGLKIHKNTHIKRLKRSDEQWQLFDESGECFKGFDWVVTSLPAEQTKNLLQKDPITAGIPDSVHTPCWALALGTRGEVDPAIQGMFGDKTISWVSRQNMKPGRACQEAIDDVWILHFSPDWSIRHGKHLDININALGQQWLESALNQPLTVVRSYYHYWRYANMVERSSSSTQNIYDGARRIGVIGDWTAGGKVSGAIESAHAFVEKHFS